MADILVQWFVLSSLLLPAWAVVEFFLMWEFEDESGPLRIDAMFAFGWSLVFWGTVAYLFTHRVLFI